MADLYTTLNMSPRKRRGPSEETSVYTPKKLRTVPPSPPPTVQSQKRNEQEATDLPRHLTRLHSIHTALQHALSHALATCAVSPAQDTGIVRNVLNSLSLNSYNGFSAQCNTEDLQRLCWLWEWDTQTLENKAQQRTDDEEDNPFLDAPATPKPKDWTRGSMGIVITAATHLSKTDKKRTPAYGIGIEVEMDIDKDMGWGMAAVTRWTADIDERNQHFYSKLLRWRALNADVSPIPEIPLANLPKLAATSSSRLLTSPRKATSVSPSKSQGTPSVNSPRPSIFTPTQRGKNSVVFPPTPSSSGSNVSRTDPPTPRTPSSSRTSISDVPFTPTTPVHQRVSSTSTPQTPLTTRRQALYERVRQKSLTASPTKTSPVKPDGGTFSRDELLKLGQEELRRRCLLGRLGGVAESAWMLFSTPSTSSNSTPSRKRRALPLSEVAQAIIKSSPVPISASEANESLDMLIKLCPFFLKPLEVTGDRWLEMPAAAPNFGDDGDKEDSAEALVTRSPKRVKREGGGLREVREIIRRELELND